MKGEKTLAELAQQFDVRPNLITRRQSTQAAREAVQTNRVTFNYVIAASRDF